MDDYLETHVPSVKNVVDRDIDSIDILRASVDGYASEYVFRKKKNAEKFMEALKEYDKQRLEEFNRTYGTDHIYPF